MKKIFTSCMCILAFFIYEKAQAQTTNDFAPLGAEWHYKTVNGWTSNGTERIKKYKVIATDMVNGKSIKTIQNTVIHTNLNGINYESIDTVITYDSVYVENDTLFIYNPIFGKYTPLNVYDVNEGDTISLPITDVSTVVGNNPEDSMMRFIIDSIRMVNYGGVILETYYTSSDDGGINWDGLITEFQYSTHRPSLNWTHSWTDHSLTNPNDTTFHPTRRINSGGYTRLFGGIGMGLKPTKNTIAFMDNLDSYILVDTITCYQDNAISFNLSSLDCDSLRYNMPVNIEELSSLGALNVYPIPASDVIHIQNDKPFVKGSQMYLIDILGKQMTPTIAIQNSNSNTIDIKMLQSGIYILIIESAGKQYYRKVKILK